MAKQLSEHDKSLIEKIERIRIEWGWVRWPEIAALSQDIEDDNEWYNKQKRERYFNTIQEAREYVAKRQEYLKSKFGEVLDFIEEMDGVEGEYFEFDRKEYLGDYANNKKDYWHERCQKNDVELNLLRKIVKLGVFNINARTVRVSNIDSVLWKENNTAIVVMKNGDKIPTNSNIEYRTVELLFGSNTSGMIMS